MNGIAMGLGLASVLQKFPHLQRQIEFAQQLERDHQVYLTLGAQRPEITRMQKFITDLAGTTVVANSKVIRAAVEYNIRRMAHGESFTPDDIEVWAKGFMLDSMAALLDEAYRDMGIDLHTVYLYDRASVKPIIDTFMANAKRLWSESQAE